MFGMVSLETDCDDNAFRLALEELEQLRLRQERQRKLEELRKKQQKPEE